MARCPAHHDRKPSLSIRDADDGKVLVRCHAGCNQELSSLHCGIAVFGQRTVRTDPSAPLERRYYEPSQDRDDDTKRSKSALKIWQSTKPPYGTAVEKYLASRGLDLPWLETIRFHPGLKHPLGWHLAGNGGAGDARC